MLIPRERLKLVTDDANEIFGSADTLLGSSVFCALLRAIIIKHSEWDIESVTRGSKIHYHGVDRVLAANDLFKDTNYAVRISHVNGFALGEINPTEGWVELSSAPFPINRYLSQYTPTRMFVNVSEQSVMAFVEKRISSRWVQAFMSILPRILTWYFPSVISAEDREICKVISPENKTISEDDACNRLADYINSAADSIDLRSLLLHKKLDGYADLHRQGMIKESQERIESLHNVIRDYTRHLSEYYSDLDSEVVKLRGLQMAETEDSGELFDFFASHKQLTVLHADASGIEFGVADTPEFYDEEEFNSIVGRKSSYLYDYADDEMIAALKAIFIDHKATFYTNAVFRLSALNLVSPRQGETFISDAIPHPHIYFYGCSGGHEQYYSEYAEKGEWQLAIEQTIAATKNINFGDHTVGGRMTRWIRDNRDTRCLKVDGHDGLMSMNEFIKYMKEGNSDG